MFKKLKRYKALKEEYKCLRTSEENSLKTQRLAEDSLIDQIHKLQSNLPKYLPGDEKYYIYPDGSNGWQVSKGLVDCVTFNADSIIRYEVQDLSDGFFSWPTLENLIFDNRDDACEAVKLLDGISDVFEANSKLDNPMLSSWITIKDIASEWWLQHVC